MPNMEVNPVFYSQRTWTSVVRDECLLTQLHRAIMSISSKYLTRILQALLFSASIVVVAAVLFNSPQSVPGSGTTWQHWQRQQRILTAQPNICRLYNFQDATAARGHFSNHAGLLHPLSLENRNPENAQKVFSLVEGRFPWKQAARLKHGALHARLSVPSTRAFTFHTWIRHFGEANPADSFYGTVCSIMSMGDGVNVGWCLQLQRPCNMLLFCMGQPAHRTAIGLPSLTQLPEEVWTPIAGTWDGEHLRLYIRGMLCAQGRYAGPYFPPAAHSRFRLGVAGNGSLAACVEFDEVALFDRCLSDEEILLMAWPELPADEESLTPLLSAGQQLVTGEFDNAESLLQPNDPLAKESALLQALIHFRRAEVLPHLRREKDAQELFQRLFDDASLPDTLRLAASNEQLLLKHGAKRPQPGLVSAARPDQWTLCREWEGHAATATDYRRALQDVASQRWHEEYAAQIRPLFSNRCGSCHNVNIDPDKFRTTGLNEHPSAANSAAIWELAVAHIRNGQMPPADHPQLSEPERAVIERWWKQRPSNAFCEQIPTESNQQYYPGYIRNRRLTRMEYRNAIRDLLGVTLSEDELPAADASGGEGFDNVGDVLFTSPSHIAAWMRCTQTAITRTLQQDLTAAGPENLRLLTQELATTLRTSQAPPNYSVLQPFIESFASRAWRRTPQPDELAQLQTLYNSTELGDDTASTLAALELTLQAILLSPHFLFIVEPQSPDGQEIIPLSADELATRLSLLVWSSVPDEPLQEAARSGRLLQPAELRRQLQRMLADPRSRALGESFGVQWLGLDEASERRPDPSLFPEFTATLKDSFREEVIRTVADVFQNNRPTTELLAAESIWVNEQLARFYGVTPPSGSSWEQVSVGDSQRGGVAALGAVLTATSYAHRTSPVLRGKWLLQNLLGETVHPPPTGIPSLESADTGNRPPTMRARLEAHRRNPDCAGCHEVMDPLGFSLEQFDPIGRWRTESDGHPVDASGLLPDETPITGLAGLKQALLQRQDQFHRHFTRKLLGYALGRPLTPLDDCLVENCLNRLKTNGFKARILLEEITLSYAFQHRYVIATPPKK